MRVTREKFIGDLFDNLPGYIEIRETTHKAKIVNRLFLKGHRELLDYGVNEQVNTYFSLATRGDKRDIKGRIEGTNNNAQVTKCLWLDFDKAESWDQIENTLYETNLDLPTYVVKSGSKNSYHLYWVLTEAIGAAKASAIVKQMAIKTGADTKPTSAAQMMRLPGSINMKNSNIVKVQMCSKEYFEPSYFDIRFGVEVYKTLTSLEKKLDKRIMTDVRKTSHMSCINRVFAGVRKGHRNFSLRWLVVYLRDIERMDKDQAYRLIVNWNGKCRPMLNNQELIYQFNYMWDKVFQGINCNAEEIRSFCTKEECIYYKDSQNKFMQGKKEEAVKYDVKLIPKLKNLSGNELIILGVFNIFETLTYRELTDKVSTKNYTYLTDKTKRKVLSELVYKGYLRKEKLNYVLDKDRYSKNYISISFKTLKDALKKKISATEYKNMLLLKSYAGENRREEKSKVIAFPTQMTLSLVQDKSRNTISEHLTSLTEKGYLTKQVYTVNKQNYLKYYLHY